MSVVPVVVQSSSRSNKENHNATTDTTNSGIRVAEQRQAYGIPWIGSGSRPISGALEQARQAGLDALREHPGVPDMIRFLEQFDNGSGDYAKERQKWGDQTSLEDILAAAKVRRKRTKTFRSRN